MPRMPSFLMTPKRPCTVASQRAPSKSSEARAPDLYAPEATLTRGERGPGFDAPDVAHPSQKISQRRGSFRGRTPTRD